LLHWRLKQVKQGFLIDSASLMQREGKVAQVFCENWAIAVSIDLDDVIVGKLLRNKLIAIVIFQTNRLIFLN